MKQAKVMLGGREFIVTEKVMGVTQKWREKLRQSSVMLIFQSLDDAIIQLLRAVDGVSENGLAGIELNQVVGIARILPVIVNGLANSIDDVRELLFDYSVEINEERDWVLENAYDSEAIDAFIEVLKLNFPIWALWGLLRGSKAQPIATNLPSVNGAIGTKKPTAPSKRR